MAEWITHAQVRKRFQDHFCESLYDHPELVTPDTVVEYEKMKDTMEEEMVQHFHCVTQHIVPIYIMHFYTLRKKKHMIMVDIMLHI